MENSVTSTKPEVEITYWEPIQPLREGEHTNNEDLKKKLNEVIKRLNSMQ